MAGFCEDMRLARVFPRRTRATPDDNDAYVGGPDLFVDGYERVDISVTFSRDLLEAERLAGLWKPYGVVEIGGPATGMRGGEFVPGKYLRRGYVITSRGCPNRCWFCDVWKREGDIRELPITSGWNVLDDNLLACSESHIREVFRMLGQQTDRAQFTGGLEAARIRPWIVDLLVNLRPRQVFMAYDTESDYEPLVNAAGMLREAGFSRQVLRCYVLIGFPGDTLDSAERRLRRVVSLGCCPMAMLWLPDGRRRDVEWRRFQKRWARPAIIYGRVKESPFLTEIR